MIFYYSYIVYFLQVFIMNIDLDKNDIDRLISSLNTRQLNLLNWIGFESDFGRDKSKYLPLAMLRMERLELFKLMQRLKDAASEMD